MFGPGAPGVRPTRLFGKLAETSMVAWYWPLRRGLGGY